VIFLDLQALLHVARRAIGFEPEVRDYGLLESALARPQSSAFGRDAYPGVHEKTASLLHSLAQTHALVDGNKRLGLAATIAFYGLNGMRLTFTNDEAYDLVIHIASGRLDDAPEIASKLQRRTEPRGLSGLPSPPLDLPPDMTGEEAMDMPRE
jgi:death on curing protein